MNLANPAFAGQDSRHLTARSSTGCSTDVLAVYRLGPIDGHTPSPGGEIMLDGYPEEEDIVWLKEELSVMDFHRGARAIQELIESTGYGRATIGINPEKLEVVTGGWSGCEEILAETHDTIWRMAFWESTHRGGLEVFLSRTAGA